VGARDDRGCADPFDRSSSQAAEAAQPILPTAGLR
jgi:hypothetical protein